MLAISTMIFLVLIVLLINFMTTERREAISNFEECVDAGNPIMESYPRQCAANGKTYVEEIKDFVYCTEEQRNVDACIEIYQPVCGFVEVQCITAPCDPVPQTFSNNCFACTNENVLYYTEGECQ